MSDKFGDPRWACPCPFCDGEVDFPEETEASNALGRVMALADRYDELAAELPTPHGPVTEAFETAARDIRRAIHTPAAVGNQQTTYTEGGDE